MDSLSPRDQDSNSPKKYFSPETRAKISASKKGRKLSEEHKQKLSDAKKGKSSHMLGKHHTEETRKKLSEANKRRPPASPETCKKISEANKGRVGCWRDKPIPPEVRARMAETRRGVKLTDEVRQKMSDGRKGMSFSAEHRARIAEATKGNQNLKNYWSTLTHDERIEKLQNWIRAPKNLVNTTIERSVSLELDKRGIAYVKQKRIGRYFVDFWIESLNLVLECDGCYWHGCIECGYDNPEKREYDRVRTQFLLDKGYQVIHLWEHDILANVEEIVANALKSSL